jgi:dTDP-4-amino-4,6-dideoxygalactose transaminase
VVSLHATKPLGCGEGGFLLCTDTDLLVRLLRRCNYGFDPLRVAQMPAMNAKMSEYHAAVTLAALDAWPKTRAALLALAARYRSALSRSQRVVLPAGWGQSWVSSTLMVRIAGGVDLDRLQVALGDQGIDTRRWWEEGCDVQPAFAAYPSLPLGVTRRIAECSLGLPFFPDMTDEDIAAVTEALRAALAASPC